MFRHTQLLISLFVTFILFPTLVWGQIQVDTSQTILPNGLAIEIRVYGFKHIERQDFREDPYYAVFIEYGDGHYASQTTMVATNEAVKTTPLIFNHIYKNDNNSTIDRQIIVSSTPIKIDGPKPPIIRREIFIPPSSGPDPTPDYVPSGLIDLQASWEEGVQINDTISTTVVTDSFASREGYLALYYNDNFFDPVNPIALDNGVEKFGRYEPLSPGLEGQVQNITFNLPDQGYYNKVIRWEYEVGSNPYSIFTDFVSKSDIQGEDFVYIAATLNDIQRDPKFADTTVLPLRVSSSRDPNDMIVIPDTIYDDQGIVELKYIINFQNEGNGTANDIKIKTKLPSELDVSSFILDSATIRRDTIVLPNQPLNPNNPNERRLKFNISEILNGADNTARWDFTNARLLGLGEGLIDPRFSEGKIVFRIKTKSDSLCVDFKTHASISFDGQLAFDTNEAEVDCIKKDDEPSLYWCLIFLIILVLFLLIVWIISSRKEKSEYK